MAQTEEHRYLHGPDTPPEPPLNCERCDYDRHECPGCGEWLYHGTEVCGPCRREHAPTDTTQENQK
ncbi:hypothetical protein SEA_MACGULLY_8 [Rhodococcus phage MacGully]|nr:hypothetical protein SEA_MACGULLY_8 [Rhodococcus phage MacGully]